MTARKVDPYRDAGKEYSASREPALVDVKPATFLTISGRGSPATSLPPAIQALYAVAFTTKMASKFAGRDYAVSKLEGLWWGPHEYPVKKPGARVWNWKLLMRTPAFVKSAQVKSAIRKLLASGRADATVNRVKLERLAEGRSIQILHVGPYDAEQPTIEQLKGFAKSRGLALRGRHHEVYLSDPRRTPPAKLRTVLRHPVR